MSSHSRGEPFNDAFRYVEWLLILPLLLLELIGSIDLPADEPAFKGFTFGFSAAVIVVVVIVVHFADARNFRFITSSCCIRASNLLLFSRNISLLHF